MAPLLQNPEWPLAIEVYFFLGGLAAGAFIVATVAELMGAASDQPVTRVGYWLAFLAWIPCPILLTADLGMPSRFLLMLSEFKPYSPMSMGSWALLGMGLFAFLTVLTLYLEGRGKARGFVQARPAFAIIGSFFSFFIAAYPGQLLAATARPLWTDSRTLGALFLAVGASTGIATVALIVNARRAEAAVSVLKLRTAYTLALIVQLLALVSVLAISGAPGLSGQALSKMLAGSLSPVFWVGAVLIGLIVPLVLEFRDGFFQGYAGVPRRPVTMVAVLILVGGFLTKLVILSAGQAV